jgi:hypothetical protein
VLLNKENGRPCDDNKQWVINQILNPRGSVGVGRKKWNINRLRQYLDISLFMTSEMPSTQSKNISTTMGKKYFYLLVKILEFEIILSISYEILIEPLFLYRIVC